MLRDAASFPVAKQIRAPEGAELGDVFSFLSGLYFRGKMAYVRRFALWGLFPGWRWDYVSDERLIGFTDFSFYCRRC